jgi:hypothetical protein
VHSLAGCHADFHIVARPRAQVNRKQKSFAVESLSVSYLTRLSRSLSSFSPFLVRPLPRSDSVSSESRLLQFPPPTAWRSNRLQLPARPTARARASYDNDLSQSVGLAIRNWVSKAVDDSRLRFSGFQFIIFIASRSHRVSNEICRWKIRATSSYCVSAATAFAF